MQSQLLAQSMMLKMTKDLLSLLIPEKMLLFLYGMQIREQLKVAFLEKKLMKLSQLNSLKTATTLLSLLIRKTKKEKLSYRKYISMIGNQSMKVNRSTIQNSDVKMEKFTMILSSTPTWSMLWNFL